MFVIIGRVDPIEHVRVVARDGGTASERSDALAVEEPLEIRVRGVGEPAISFVTTMRTPGADDDLVAGLLVSEGVLETRADLVALETPTDPRIDPALRENVRIATLSPAALERARKLARGTVMGSACGVCGRTSIEDVLRGHTRAPTRCDADSANARAAASPLTISTEVLFALPDRLRAAQSVFATTGGLHAAALFDRHGALIDVREDVGRHNATDKVLGSRWLASRFPIHDGILVVSGRAGFEIVQKAVVAGVPIVASVSAPSSLAVELAESAGVTLVGFLRDRRCNVYAHPRRVT